MSDASVEISTVFPQAVRNKTVNKHVNSVKIRFIDQSPFLSIYIDGKVSKLFQFFYIIFSCFFQCLKTSCLVKIRSSNNQHKR